MIRFITYLFFAFVLFAVNVNAQVNLVLNPSFEELKHCPTFLNQADSAKYWDWVSPLSPNASAFSCKGELFNICGTYATGCSEPVNDMGYQKPRTGNSYIGLTTIYSFPPSSSNKRDYLKGQLRNTLVSGKNYCVKFYYSAGDNIVYSTNQFGAYVDNGAVSTYNCCKDFPITPQIQNNPSVFMEDTMNWVKIQGSFMALGNENTITLGNFVDSSIIQYHLFNAAGHQDPEYYIDDVSLISMDTVAFAGNNKTICAGDKVFLGRKQEVGLECIWYDMNGHQLYDSAGWYVQPTQTTSYIVKMDNCFISYDTVTITVIPNIKGNVTITASPKNICPSASTQLQATAPNNIGLQWNWQTNNLVSNYFIPNPTTSPTVSTIYTLITTPSSTSIYCGADTSKVTVHVINLKPIPFAGRDTTICKDASTTIGNNSNLCTWCAYQWFPSIGINHPNSASAIVTLPTNLNSQIYILAQTDSCQTTTDNIKISTKDCSSDSIIISVPNVFTPNNDGKNDTWSMIILNGLQIFDLQTTIYNRWGKKVFESTNVHQNWNGHNLYEGSPCSADTYFYVITYTDGNTKETKTLQGFLEIIR